MQAKAGRASYTADTHLTQPDPGAYAMAIIFEAIETAYIEFSKWNRQFRYYVI